MNRFVRCGVVVLVLCGISLVGCAPKRIWLQIAGFDDGLIDGVWLWRLSQESGTYERACRFPFAGVGAPGNVESLAYVQECEDGAVSGQFYVPIRRSQIRPDTVTVGLWYLNWSGAGAFKISSYGLNGETALSGSTLQF